MTAYDLIKAYQTCVPKLKWQLNALGRLQKYMGKPEKVAIVNNFIYANFNYWPLVWHFSTCELIRKMRKSKNVA